MITPDFSIVDRRWPSRIIVAPEADKTNSTGREFTPLLEISRFQCRFVPAFVNGVLTRHSFHFLAHPTRQNWQSYCTLVRSGFVMFVLFLIARASASFSSESSEVVKDFKSRGTKCGNSAGSGRGLESHWPPGIRRAVGNAKGGWKVRLETA